MFLFTPEKKVRETQRHTQKDKIYQPKNGKSQNATKNRYVAYTHSPWLQFQKVPRSFHFPSSTLMSNSIAWSKWKKKNYRFFSMYEVLCGWGTTTLRTLWSHSLGALRNHFFRSFIVFESGSAFRKKTHTEPNISTKSTGDSKIFERIKSGTNGFWFWLWVCVRFFSSSSSKFRLIFTLPLTYCN